MYIHRSHMVERQNLVMRHRKARDSIVEALAAQTLGGDRVFVTKCGGPRAQSDSPHDNCDGDCGGDTQDGRCV